MPNPSWLLNAGKPASTYHHHCGESDEKSLTHGAVTFRSPSHCGPRATGRHLTSLCPHARAMPGGSSWCLTGRSTDHGPTGTAVTLACLLTSPTREACAWTTI